MPYIVKKLKADEIDFANKRTLVLDVKETNRMIKDEETEFINKLKNRDTYELEKVSKIFRGYSLFEEVVANKDAIKSFSIELPQIETEEEFFEIVWNQTVFELMFISQYYLQLVSDSASFEKIIFGNNEFDYWFENDVKYVMVEKIERFYRDLCRYYADRVSLNIFEIDVEAKTKEVADEIIFNHLVQVKSILESAWSTALIKFEEWQNKINKKRESILFD